MAATRDQNKRNDQTRAAQSRAVMDRWAPPEAIRTPEPMGGFRFRWIAEYVRGEYQDRNLNTAMREGYTPVRRDELPETFFSAPSDDGLVRSGGLILMKIPEEFCRQREEYYLKQSQDALKGANALQGLETPGNNMPTFEEDASRRLEGAEALNALREGG